jgi:hypothetical protein
MDEGGEWVTSCVIEPVEELSVRQSKKKLPAAQYRALQLLDQAICAAGEIPRPNPDDHIPANVQCVKEPLWREYCYKGGISNSDEQEAKRQAFTRAAKELVVAGRVGKWDPWVWIVR